VDSRHPARERSGVTLHLVPNAGHEGAGGEEPSGTLEEPAGAHREPAGARPFRRYPLWRVVALNGLTVVHYLVGGGAILAAYRDYPIVGWPLGVAYLVFAMVQLYVLMPQVVCPGCVYRTIRDGRCPSGLNLISARLAPPAASAVEFGQRTHGALCQSSLCLWSWLLPVPLALPGLVVSFSWTAASLTAVVAALAVARLTIVARVAVCPHCLARRWCAEASAHRAAPARPAA
jgi:hypothetical protein